MKNLFFILIVILVSCSKIETSEIKTTNEQIVDNSYTPSKEVYGYHYGYSFMKGKYCYHYGLYTEDEKYSVSFTLLNDTIISNSKNLYQLTQIGQDITINYVDKYRIKKDSSKLFIGHEIKSIILTDTTISW